MLHRVSFNKLEKSPQEGWVEIVLQFLKGKYLLARIFFVYRRNYRHHQQHENDGLEATS